MLICEIRRGDDDSATTEYLGFNVRVDSYMSDELQMRLQLEHPEKISIGSEPDVLVCAITNEYFFSQLDSQQKLKEGDQIKMGLSK